MKAPQSLHPNAGFSLIESMLALVVLAIGMLALAGLQVTALRGNALSRRTATAIAMAEQKMEQVKNTPLVNIQAESPPVNIDPVTGQVTAAATKWTRQVTVTNGPLPNSRAVSVIVSWREKAKTYTVPIATIIGQ